MRVRGPLTLLLLLSGCSGEPGQALVDHEMVAVVYGLVTRAEDGQPVAEARVRASAFPESTGGCARGGGTEVGWTHSLDDGSYVITAGYDRVSDEEEMCVLLEVRPDSASGLTDAQVEGGAVTFRVRYLTPPVDSLRVDVGLALEEVG